MRAQRLLGLIVFTLAGASCSNNPATRPTDIAVQGAKTERRVDLRGGTNGVCIGNDCPDITFTLTAADGSRIDARCFGLCNVTGGTGRFADASGNQTGHVHVQDTTRLEFSLIFVAPSLGAQAFLTQGDFPATTVTTADSGCLSGQRTTMTAQGSLENLGLTVATATFCVL